MGIGSICQFDFQDSDIVDDGSGNGGDEQEDGRCEEEECADVMEEAGGHFEGWLGGLLRRELRVEK